MAPRTLSSILEWLKFSRRYCYSWFPPTVTPFDRKPANPVFNNEEPLEMLLTSRLKPQATSRSTSDSVPRCKAPGPGIRLIVYFDCPDCTLLRETSPLAYASTALAPLLRLRAEPVESISNFTLHPSISTTTTITLASVAKAREEAKQHVATTLPDDQSNAKAADDLINKLNNPEVKKQAHESVKSLAKTIRDIRKGFISVADALVTFDYQNFTDQDGNVLSLGKEWKPLIVEFDTTLQFSLVQATDAVVMLKTVQTVLGDVTEAGGKDLAAELRAFMKQLGPKEAGALEMKNKFQKLAEDVIRFNVKIDVAAAKADAKIKGDLDDARTRLASLTQELEAWNQTMNASTGEIIGALAVGAGQAALALFSFNLFGMMSAIPPLGFPATIVLVDSSFPPRPPDAFLFSPSTDMATTSRSGLPLPLPADFDAVKYATRPDNIPAPSDYDLSEINAENVKREKHNKTSIVHTRNYVHARASTAGVGIADVGLPLKPFLAYAEDDFALLVGSKEVVDLTGPLPGYMTMLVARHRLQTAEKDVKEKERREKERATKEAEKAAATRPIFGTMTMSNPRPIGSTISGPVTITAPWHTSLYHKIYFPLHWWSDEVMRRASATPHVFPCETITTALSSTGAAVVARVLNVTKVICALEPRRPERPIPPHTHTHSRTLLSSHSSGAKHRAFPSPSPPPHESASIRSPTLPYATEMKKKAECEKSIELVNQEINNLLARDQELGTVRTRLEESKKIVASVSTQILVIVDIWRTINQDMHSLDEALSSQLKGNPVITKLFLKKLGVAKEIYHHLTVLLETYVEQTNAANPAVAVAK
ncbi:hypothetical protein B0H16DRAFT_1785603 [Mycena metata]|uniref:Uncharacterized protein n=1 Tax=Mycena metata TaxID=1033252 RepID=A0AAD7HNC8_9AGAR|nr:hypothetical protein B0H16DRAFT_1785603 [Mycena metata]